MLVPGVLWEANHRGPPEVPTHDRRAVQNHDVLDVCGRGRASGHTGGMQFVLGKCCLGLNKGGGRVAGRCHHMMCCV